MQLLYYELLFSQYSPGHQVTVHSLLLRPMEKKLRITNYHQCDEHLPIAVDAYPSPCISVHSQ
jgi:hypothetical protein